MAVGAVINALWDLRAKREGKPLWASSLRSRPEEIVDLVDFRYLSDALTPEDALGILRRARARAGGTRTAAALTDGYPAYTTTPGWLGYDDEKLHRLSVEAVEDGFTFIKLKVGRDVEEDIRRWAIARDAVGPDVAIAIDANQRWEVAEAIDWVRKLGGNQPFWIEEPTSPDDILGHAAIRAAVAPVLVATGEHVANRVVFKQMLMAGSLDVAAAGRDPRRRSQRERRHPSARGEVRGSGLPARRRGRTLRARPHLAMFDLVAVSGSSEGRVIEYVDHLHEHFVDPVEISAGATCTDDAGVQHTDAPSTLATFRYPQGDVWAQEASSL